MVRLALAEVTEEEKKNTVKDVHAKDKLCLRIMTRNQVWLYFVESQGSPYQLHDMPDAATSGVAALATAAPLMGENLRTHERRIQNDEKAR